MYFLSKLFGFKKQQLDGSLSTHEARLCAWAIRQMAAGITADGLAMHASTCPVCGPALAAWQQKNYGGQGRPKVDIPKDTPSCIIVGVEGLLDLGQILAAIREQKKIL
jgi:hypothetical protein